MGPTVSGVRAPRRPRLLWLIDSLTTGGAERLVPTFARHVDQGRFDLRVVSLREIEGNPVAEELRGAGTPVTVLGALSLRDVSALARLVRLVRQEKIDLIHTHLTYADTWGRLAGLVTGRPVVSTLHVRSYLNPYRRGRRDRVIESLATLARRRLGETVIAVSDALRAELIARGFPPERIVTVRNGIELDRFDPPAGFSREEQRARLGIPADAFVCVTVAVLREGKGHDLLLRAARRVSERSPEARFLVVGGGPLESELRREVDRAGLAGRITLTGMRRDVPEVLAASDLFVLPSSQFDALPTVLMEAMAAALPVVAVALGGVPEIVSDGETGLLVPDADAGALADAVLQLLGDPARARLMGGRGRRRAEREFSAEAWVQRLQEIYERHLGGVRG